MTAQPCVFYISRFRGKCQSVFGRAGQAANICTAVAEICAVFDTHGHCAFPVLLLYYQGTPKGTFVYIRIQIQKEDVSPPFLCGGMGAFAGPMPPHRENSSAGPGWAVLGGGLPLAGPGEALPPQRELEGSALNVPVTPAHCARSLRNPHRPGALRRHRSPRKRNGGCARCPGPGRGSQRPGGAARDGRRAGPGPPGSGP